MACSGPKWEIQAAVVLQVFLVKLLVRWWYLQEAKNEENALLYYCKNLFSLFMAMCLMRHAIFTSTTTESICMPSIRLNYIHSWLSQNHLRIICRAVKLPHDLCCIWNLSLCHLENGFIWLGNDYRTGQHSGDIIRKKCWALPTLI